MISNLFCHSRAGGNPDYSGLVCLRPALWINRERSAGGENGLVF